VSSIYELAMGSDFARLHPQIQKRFGFSSADGVASIGTGVMDEIWHGRGYTVPFLWVGSWRNILVPEMAKDVPFEIGNYAYRDELGRETVTWIRRFGTQSSRRFDAYMIYSTKRRCIVDYLGTHQHLAVDIEMKVAENGGVQLRSGAQRFYEGMVGFPFPMLFSGVAEVNEWYDDAEECFRISVNVSNRAWGPLFGYHGKFQAAWIPTRPEQIPAEIFPRRTEARE
jgi:hypothetical protein